MNYRNSIEFEVSGDLALFSDPNTRIGGEKSTYLIPTYEAIKGVIHSIYFKPTIVWYVDEIRVMNPIQTETKGILVPKYSEQSSDRSYYTYLTNVRYQVRAHFEFNENRPELEQDRNENKHHNIALRMIERGGRRDVFLGTRECQAFVEPCRFGEGESFYDAMPGEISFGMMYNGITYPDEAVLKEDKDKMTIRYWTPVMKPGGYIAFPRPEEITVKRAVKKVKGFKKSGIKENLNPVEEERVDQ